jgi:hypothetical protein
MDPLCSINPALYPFALLFSSFPGVLLRTPEEKGGEWREERGRIEKGLHCALHK